MAPAEDTTFVKPENGFAKWRQEQTARISSQRCFHFYSMYCYYYALYAQCRWPKQPLAGGQQQSQEFAALDETHFRAAPAHPGVDAGHRLAMMRGEQVTNRLR